MRLRFWKMSGAGNDFVLLAGLPKGAAAPALARRLCDRRRGVGADGLLVMTRERGGVRLRYWNADGSPAFCGNGARCGAVWARARGWVKGRRFALATGGGRLEARITGPGRAQIAMPAPRELRLNLRLKAKGRVWNAHFVDTGVPHLVLFVPNLESVDVRGLGCELRFHRELGKAGANVDFVRRQGGALAVRTYERGVEDETLACGTGLVAAAAVAHRLGRAPARARLRARGGDVLHVELADDRATLEGPAAVVYEGMLTSAQ